MRNLLIIGTVILSGCVVAPTSAPSSGTNVIVYPPVRVSPGVEIVYVWDPVQIRYYWVDRRDSRHYMPYDWKHPHGHRPPGHDHWDKKDRDDRRDDKRNRR